MTPSVADDAAQADSPAAPIRPPAAARRGAPTAETVGGLGRWLPSGERALVGLLLVGAALARLTGLGVLEPNVATAEVSHLVTLEALLADREPGLFGAARMGATGLALLPAALLRLVRPEPELALRLYVALGSLAFIALFYRLCRSRFSPVVSLATTGLLAFSPWSLAFGRSGELEVFVAAWGAAAALALVGALKIGTPRRWLLAGAAATAGLYWHPSAVWLLPALTVPVVWVMVERPTARPRLTVGLCIFLAAGLLVAAPRVPALIDGPIATSELLAEEGATREGREPLLGRAQQVVRAFLILDPTAGGDPRYQPSGQPPFDGLTGLLLLAGLVLAAWKLPARTLPLSLALVPLVGGQLASPRVPGLADALVALPGIYLLVAEAIERLVAVLPFPAMTRAVLLAAIPAYALVGWQAYSGWTGTAASAAARQPALDYDEVDAFLGEQRARLLAGQPAAGAKAWRDAHPRLVAGSRVVRRPREAGPGSVPLAPARLALQQIASIPGEPGARAPRGVAAAPSGDAFVADATGRVSRVDSERNVLVALPRRPPSLEQIGDLAADADGFLYLADAERSLIVKLGPSGEQVATLGADWGMYRPRGLAIGPDGRLYVADTGRNRIAIGSTDGRFVRALAPPPSFGPFEQPTDVAVDLSGRVYVGLPEIGRIAVLDDGGQVIGGWTVPRGNTIESPRLAVVADGAIAMTDLGQGRVLLLDADGRELASAEVAGRPYGVAVASGRLYVSEPAAGRVIVFALDSP